MAVYSSTSKKALILCFDGTGNKFSGTAADSNIVKIFSLLDREDPLQCHYYQPGIGTYVETSSLSRKSRFGRIKSWYTKAKDQAVGTSFGEHVMSGYKFLMRYYTAGDDIYFFGAAMLDTRQNRANKRQASVEEHTLHAFWLRCLTTLMDDAHRGERRREKKHDTFHFMRKFRETFSRPIDRISFIGLFDCVNSVPQFETAWMRRTKFPYAAKTTAKTIRHAVSIDERRAKFRQDLISEARTPPEEHATTMRSQWHHLVHHDEPNDPEKETRPVLKRAPTSLGRFRPSRRHHQTLAPMPISSAASQVSVDSTAAVREAEKKMSVDHSDEEHQDILEVWFAGQHGDIGGGWPVANNERCASELPLLWMIREARRAGMPVDEAKLDKLFKQAEGLGPAPWDSLSAEESEFLATKTRIHDSLRFGGGLSWYAVLSWQIMEHLPFRRMDLQPDGTWKPISWPLPRGETRDMPDEALIHCSVLTRMKADPKYRPGNLIIGGGGRVQRVAPAHAGTGEWRIAHEQGDLLGEAVVRFKKEHASDDLSSSRKS
ncbi:hypothetical protein AMS68_007250 [Peltaster fructicola]|uniref:T6SS Phospholipase effector Tle1-like catalytic domain-containing protein n=1 Tax=Peltaster fructicola TaxID=286661 RepID=A0A6H0Y402_9PEZI|nr:hypothetical protein AMS68_007250 [Peltaster fructicola]